MVNQGETSFASRLMRVSSSLYGTRQCWSTQRLNLAAMQEAIGMPTIFFTLGAADNQWPKIQHLMRSYRSNVSQDNASERIGAATKILIWDIGSFCTEQKHFEILFAN